ncbi:shikimate dehydrogenase family protein [Oricola cellulosilytica]|uniref:Shikimate dehydrogenase n=1 Tax=Oricola cellulosilytica TaxID=1429082 RepID=A0A4R0PJ05_9HYPH|nr:shikimate dehydrogenase [Oricola cellulosilytica]TCD16693.1 shikimate dehydrogenase [Oricola cellulosilytica]
MISGRTQIIAHIGVPTESFKSPMIYNPWFEAIGIDTVVVPMGCEAEDYPAFLRLIFKLRNIQGALITMPHKVMTVGLLDKASPSVRVCGACNAVKRDEAGRLIGDIFDGEGFVRGMQHKGRTAAGATALVVGSGGVGSAIAASLAKAGVTRLGLFDTQVAAAEKVAANVRGHYPDIAISTGSNDPAGWDILVNATPLGMNEGDPMPMPVERIASTSFVGEVVMQREETPFLAAARGRGCATLVGTDMLFEQIPAYLEFFGLPAATPEKLRSVSKIRY